MPIGQNPVIEDDATITFQLPSAMLLSIRAMAEAEGRSVGDLILSCVESWMPHGAGEYREMSAEQAQAAARAAADQADVE